MSRNQVSPMQSIDDGFAQARPTTSSVSKRFKKDRPNLPPLPIGKITKKREDNSGVEMISSQAGQEDKGESSKVVFDGRKEFAEYLSKKNDPLHNIMTKKTSNDLLAQKAFLEQLNQPQVVRPEQRSRLTNLEAGIEEILQQSKQSQSQEKLPMQSVITGKSGKKKKKKKRKKKKVPVERKEESFEL